MKSIQQTRPFFLLSIPDSFEIIAYLPPDNRSSRKPSGKRHTSSVAANFAPAAHLQPHLHAVALGRGFYHFWPVPAPCFLQLCFVTICDTNLQQQQHPKLPTLRQTFANSQHHVCRWASVSMSLKINTFQLHTIQNILSQHNKLRRWATERLLGT